MSKKSAFSGVLVVMGLVGLSIKAYYDKVQLDKAEQQQLEEVEVLPLNGEFVCEYYKAKTQVLEGISWYEVSSSSRGWSWTFSMEDGTAIFYVQTPGQFCYVRHVEEE